MKLTKAIARKVLNTVDAGLCSGLGSPEPGKMCVEAAVCYALGLPHGDKPTCVGASVRRFKIALNDALWSCDRARTAGLRKLAIAQLGSDEIDQREFSELLTLKVIQRLCPRLFRELAKTAQGVDKATMEQAAVDCETVTDLKAAADKLARARALALDLDLDLDLALALALDLDLDLALALDLDLDLALALALDLDNDESLTLLADICLECLVELHSPGCEWLDLCERKETKP